MIVNEREIRTKNPNVENAYCFIFELNGKGYEPSRLELWLEPAWLVLITRLITLNVHKNWHAMNNFPIEM